MNPWLVFVLTCLLMAAVAAVVLLVAPVAFARWIRWVARRRADEPPRP